MKKFLSIFIAVAMVLSFTGMFTMAPVNGPVAKAAGEAITITRGPTLMKNLCGIDYPVVQYTMGDFITGQIRGYNEALNPQTTADKRTHVYLLDNAGTVILKDPVDTNGGFSLQTTSVIRDGDYYLYWAGYNDADDDIGVTYSHPAGELKYTYLSGGATRDAIYIKYIFAETSPNSLRFDCLSHVFSGWVKTGGTSTTTTVNVQVHVIMPDGTDAPGSPVSVGTDGGWSLSVQINQKGTYKVWLDESPNAGDPTNSSYGTCKQIVYYEVTTGVTSITLTPVVKPTILYNSGQTQQFAIYAIDEDGDAVTGIPASAWTITNLSGATVSEPFDGVYLFSGVPSAAGSVNVSLVNYTYLGSTVSASTIVTVKEPSAFNPYVTIWGDQTQRYNLENDNGVGDVVYEKFPCTPGNWIGLTLGLADLGDGQMVKDPAKDSVWEARSWVSGPVERLTWSTAYPGNNRWVYGSNMLIPGSYPNSSYRYLVTGQGTVKVTVKAKIWEKAAGDCPWNPATPNASRASLENIDSDPDAAMNNTCCIEKEQTFEICTIHACKVDITNSETQMAPKPKMSPFKVDGQVENPKDMAGATQMYLTVGDTTDLKFALTQDPESPINCGCNIIIHLKAVGPTAGRDMFKLADGEVTDEIWYNPAGKIPAGYTTAPTTTDPSDWTSTGGVVTLKGVTVQHSAYWYERLGMEMTNVSQGILVEVYGELMKTCPQVTVYPKIYYNPIAIEVLPKVTEMSTEILNSQVSDPEEMVAGVSEVLKMSGFNPASGVLNYVDEGWYSGEWLNNTYYDVSNLGSGIYQTTISPAFDRAGTFYFDIYANDGDSMGEATVKVVKPEFTIKIVTNSGEVIDNDNTITEGVVEGIQFSAVDPRDESIQLTATKAFAIPSGIGDAFYGTPIYLGYYAYDLDYTTDEWPVGSCGLPSSFVYNANVCGGCSPLNIIALDNPNVTDPPQIMVFWQRDGANVMMNLFDVVVPNVTVSPDKDIPFYGCPTCGNGTDITFTAKDAHDLPLVGAEVVLSHSVAPYMADVNWSDAVLTGKDGKVVYHFNPPFAGMFSAALSADAASYTWPNCEHDWMTRPKEGFLARTKKVFTTVYKAPEKDTEAPVLTVTAPEDGATVDTDTVKVEGTVTDNFGVKDNIVLYIGAEKINLTPDGTFSADVTLAEGENVIKVVAFDAAGKKDEKDITVTYEKPAPVKKTVVTVQIGSDIMTVNGQVAQLDVAPVIHDGHTYLPLRAIAEALGAKVDWVAETKGITLTLGKHTVGLQIGNSSAVVDGNVVEIFPPYLQPYGDGTYAATMVPLRVIAEGLGAVVNWDPATRTVTITLVQSGS